MEKKEEKEEKKDEVALKRLSEIYRHSYNSEFLHYFQEKSSNLFYYSLKASHGRVITIREFTSPDLFDSVQIVNRIFLCGGYKMLNFKPKFLTDHYECVLEEGKRFGNMIEKAGMNMARSQHALCAIKDNWIYCMGGKNSEKGKVECLSEVEKYDIKENKWVIIPSMTEKKMNVSACAFNQEMVYIFGGYNYGLGGALATIEFLDTNKESDGWKVYEITKQMMKVWKPHYWMGLYHYATDKIIIFGGNSTDDSFIFNVKKGILTRCERQISYKVNFCQRKAELWKDEVKCVDYQRRDVCEYSIEKDFWGDRDHEYSFYPRKPIKLPEQPH